MRASGTIGTCTAEAARNAMGSDPRGARGGGGGGAAASPPPLSHRSLAAAHTFMYSDGNCFFALEYCRDTL